MRTILAATLVILGCGRPSPRSDQTPLGTVVTALGQDTVVVAQTPERRLEWFRSSPARRLLLWSTGSAIVVPSARLLFANNDSLPDLWVTVDFEEMLSAELLLDLHDSVSKRYESGLGTCALPELRDVNRDGRIDIIEHLAGAIGRGECRGDAAAAPCVHAYHLTWERVLFQGPDGAFAQDAAAGARFYDSLSTVYRASANALAQALRAGHTPAARCNGDMLQAIDGLEHRAAQLAGADRMRPARTPVHESSSGSAKWRDGNGFRHGG